MSSRFLSPAFTLQIVYCSCQDVNNIHISFNYNHFVLLIRNNIHTLIYPNYAFHTLYSTRANEIKMYDYRS